MAIPTKPTTGKPEPQRADAERLAELRDLGFSNEAEDEPYRLIVSASGKEGTGKSHLAFTAPEPVFLFNIDIGTEGVLKKFQVAGHDIYVYKVRVPKGARQDVYETMWHDVEDRIRKVYKYNEGTLAMDTATETFELARLSHFGKLVQVKPHHYTEVNSEWRELIRLAYDSKMSTIYINKVKPVYINDVRTKDYETSGFSEMGYLAQLDLTTFREKDADGNIKFGLRINKCRKRASLMGEELRTVIPVMDSESLILDPVINFSYLLDLVHNGRKE